MFPPRLSSSWALATLLSVVSAATSDAARFENTAVVRTIDLGGATTQITTSYQIRSLQDNNSRYLFSLSKSDASRTSWIEAKVKGGQTPLEVQPYLDAPVPGISHYRVTFPKPLKLNETATVILNTIQSHASSPLPATIGQNDAQNLIYETGLYVLSDYETLIQRIKLRAPNPNILSYTESPSATFAEGDAKPVTKSGSTITYGPFRSLPPSASSSFLKKEQESIKLHYNFDAPVLTVPKLKRAAEISHWGSNLNIQDEVWLVNDGAKLKGHFSRLEHIKQQVHAHTSQPHVLRNVVLHLPSGVSDPYYYDVIGNVSTSHFRPTATRIVAGKRASPLERSSIIDFKPRYPLLGGWNYTYTMGYDLPLQEWAGYDAKRGAYVVAVPFLTAIPGTSYDDVEVKIILPEGAKVLEYTAPFEAAAVQTNHVTYLDTVGRPAITFKKTDATEKHSGLIYVTYTVDAKAHLQKPLAVAAVCFGVFTLAMSLRRLDISIHTKKYV